MKPITAPLLFGGHLVDAQPDGEFLARIVAFRSRGWLPVHRGRGPAGEVVWFQEDSRGESLEHLLAQSSGDSEAPWRAIYPDGRLGLVRAFAGFARLHAALRAAGIPLRELHPACIHVARADGTLCLRARDWLIEEERPASGAALHYAPPELLLAAADARRLTADSGGIYSLAALLHHALTGAPPYPGRSETEIVHRILAGEAHPQSHWPRELPATIQRYLLDSVNLDPQFRPPSFSVFAGGLEAAAAGDVVRAAPRDLVVAVRDPVRRRLRVRLGIAAAVLALLVYFSSSSESVRRSDLLGELSAVVRERPFPGHGEDPPLDPAAQSVLERWDFADYLHDPEVQLQRGWAELRAGSAERALVEFRRVTAHERDSIRGWISIGIARLELGDIAGESDLHHALALRAETLEDHIHQGAGWRYLLDFARAIQSFEAAAWLDADSVVVWSHLAELRWYEDDLPGARSALERWRSLRPDSPWLIWLEAELLAAEGKRDRALTHLRERKARLLGSPALMLRAGSLLVRSGRENEGAEWIESAKRTLFKGAAPSVRFTSKGRPVFAERSCLREGPPPAGGAGTAPLPALDGE